MRVLCSHLRLSTAPLESSHGSKVSVLCLTLIHAFHLSGPDPTSPLANLYDNQASFTYTTKLLPELLKLYPDDPALGSPFNPMNVSNTDRFYGPTNQYKRLSAMVGDGIFQSGTFPICNVVYMVHQ